MAQKTGLAYRGAGGPPAQLLQPVYLKDVGDGAEERKREVGSLSPSGGVAVGLYWGSRCTVIT